MKKGVTVKSLKKPERIFKIGKNDQKVVYCIESFSICEQNQCFHFETTGMSRYKTKRISTVEILTKLKSQC